MSDPQNGLMHGRAPNGEWIPIKADNHGRIRCHLIIAKEHRIVEVERIVEVVVPSGN